MGSLTVQIGTEPIGCGVVFLVDLSAHRVPVGPVGPRQAPSRRASATISTQGITRTGPVRAWPGPTFDTSLTRCFSLLNLFFKSISWLVTLSGLFVLFLSTTFSCLILTVRIIEDILRPQTSSDEVHSGACSADWCQNQSELPCIHSEASAKDLYAVERFISRDSDRSHVVTKLGAPIKE